MVGAFDHPKEGSFPGLRTPVRFTGLDDPEVSPPPALGDSTESILQGRLGLTPDAIAALKAEGTI